MPFLIGLVGLIVAAYFWAQRARNAARITQELGGVASDVMAAARRFGFRQKLNVHPVESVDDPALAIAGAALAFVEIGALPSSEQHDALIRSLQSHLDLNHDKAHESLILGRWLMAECGTAVQAFGRLIKRLHKMQGPAGFDPLMAVLRDAAAQAGSLTPLQKEALDEVAVQFRLR